MLELSAIDIKLNNRITTIVNEYDCQQIFSQISEQFVDC